MLIGREKELALLEKYYNENTAHLIFLTGQKRIGKTSILNEFSKNKNPIFYVFNTDIENVQLELFSKIIPAAYKTKKK